jgi:hypothetical protein
MIAVHVQPDVTPVRVVKHGIVTVPGDMATLKVPRGMRINAIPLEYRLLQRKLLEVGKMFVHRQGLRGLRFIDSEDIHVYGPFPSYEYHEAMIDIDSIGDPQVRDRSTEMAFADYVLVAAFYAKPVMTEIWTPDTRLRDLKGVR